jgi:hypothetical protein
MVARDDLRRKGKLAVATSQVDRMATAEPEVQAEWFLQIECDLLGCLLTALASLAMRRSGSMVKTKKTSPVDPSKSRSGALRFDWTHQVRGRDQKHSYDKKPSMVRSKEFARAARLEVLRRHESIFRLPRLNKRD